MPFLLVCLAIFIHLMPPLKNQYELLAIENYELKN